MRHGGGRGRDAAVVALDGLLAFGRAQRVPRHQRGGEQGGDGEEAKELLATLGPVVWLVVSDVQMPRMGGEELADLVAERWPKLPVLLTSGQGHPPEGHTGPFLPKPYAPGALVSAVRALLPPSGCPACR